MTAGETPADDSEPIGLDELEKRVRAAARRLRSLAAENERLAARVAELEAGAKAARKAKAGSGQAAEDDGAAEWRRERTEVRRRVDRLARRLADLLDGPT